MASQSLQATHDDAVQTRTHLRLRTEAEEQEQKLQEFKLKREKERTKLSKHEITIITLIWMHEWYVQCRSSYSCSLYNHVCMQYTVQPNIFAGQKFHPAHSDITKFLSLKVAINYISSILTVLL